ncbi:MAG TPA: hypothetical protein VNA25_17855 [Phycisphaerae bacterium]|nr:hypothetical protein [Phycisphaerae bacterium]
MAWTELLGSGERSEGTDYIDFECRYLGGTGEAVPARGATHVTVTSGSLISSDLTGLLVEEPMAEHIRNKPRFRMNRQLLTVVYRGYFKFV